MSARAACSRAENPGTSFTSSSITRAMRCLRATTASQAFMWLRAHPMVPGVHTWRHVGVTRRACDSVSLDPSTARSRVHRTPSRSHSPEVRRQRSTDRSRLMTYAGGNALSAYVSSSIGPRKNLNLVPRAPFKLGPSRPPVALIV